MENELLRQRLYRIFRIEDENYMYTMKVMYIYRWVSTREEGNPLDIITELRQQYKRRKNTERLDAIFRHMQGINEARYAAPRGAQPPQSQSKYSSGWKLG